MALRFLLTFNMLQQIIKKRPQFAAETAQASCAYNNLALNVIRKEQPMARPVLSLVQVRRRMMMRKLNGRLWAISSLLLSVGICTIGCGSGSIDGEDVRTAASSWVEYGSLGESGPQVFFMSEGSPAAGTELLNWDPTTGLIHVARTNGDTSRESDMYVLTVGDEVFSVEQTLENSIWLGSVIPLLNPQISRSASVKSQSRVEDVAVLENCAYFKDCSGEIQRATFGVDGQSTNFGQTWGRVFGVRNMLVVVEGQIVFFYDADGNLLRELFPNPPPLDPNTLSAGSNGLCWLSGEFLYFLDLSGELPENHSIMRAREYRITPPGPTDTVCLDEHAGKILMAIVEADGAVASLSEIDWKSGDATNRALPSRKVLINDADPLSRRLGIQFLFLP